MTQASIICHQDTSKSIECPNMEINEAKRRYTCTKSVVVRLFCSTCKEASSDCGQPELQDELFFFVF